ncbi:MAG TPA: lamin tail domain-containing protein [Gaiellaceae bacterium]|nr:lamin tail domain-containing protein [Gaiellaceae bacterium]
MHRIRLVVLLLLASVLLAAPAAHGTSSGLVVSQVYASGGNSGATYANDYVELLNRGSTPVDLTGWTLQYASASSTSWQTTALAGTVQPGRYYLVALASGGTTGTSLPAADATGTSNLAAAGGKVAVVADSTALGCGASAGSCSTAAGVVDLVGYGSATDFEGAGAAPAPDATTADVRAGTGCTDTDDNAADFTKATADPHNSSSAAATCSGGGGGGGGGGGSTGASQTAAVDVDVQPVLSISLEHAALSFGNAVAGQTPAPLSERVTVVSNSATGYALTVHRSAFTPADLPLAIASTAPAGGQLGSGLGGGALVPIPVAPAPDLAVGTTSTATSAGGDVWPASLGFASPLPVVPPGHYTATVTFTAVAR